MKRSDFNLFRARFIEASRAVLREGRSDVLAEAAFPAYSNPNPLASFLFWRRIRLTMNFLRQHAPFGAALDFGCGGGVMLPFLAGAADRVVAVDRELGPLTKMQAHLEFPENIETFDASANKIEELDPSAFDVITALDVLEHVEDLDHTLRCLRRALRPGGKLVVSGPTENVFYRLGRKLSGEEYAGHYHVRNIYQIRRAMAEHTTVRTLATLFYPIPLFKIYCGRVGSS